MNMSRTLPEVFLVLHGETAWSLNRQATCRADIPLINHGERDEQELVHGCRACASSKCSAARCDAHGERWYLRVSTIARSPILIRWNRATQYPQSGRTRWYSAKDHGWGDEITKANSALSAPPVASKLYQAQMVAFLSNLAIEGVIL